MHDARQEQVFKIRENIFKRFGMLRRTCWQGRQNRAGLRAGRDPPCRDVLPVIRDPVGYFVKMLAKNIRRDVAEFRYGVLRVSLNSFGVL